MKKRRIIITTDFIAIHHWPGCDIPEVDYLRFPHRHKFYVQMKFNVSHADRDIEFISKKEEIDTYIHEHLFPKTGIEAVSKITLSCEAIAEQLLDRFGAQYVSVFEDNENGAEVYV